MISIIIPTHNDGDNLKLAIESIQNQTYKNIEIIVIDDFSTDNTKTLIKDIAKHDIRVKYHLNIFNDPKRIGRNGVNINAGYSARNYGLSLARGKWITFQDGDDISLLNRIEVQLNLVEKYKVSHLTTSVVWMEGKYINKKIDFDKFFNVNDISNMLVGSYKINQISKEGIGFFSKILPELIFCKIPFFLKRRDPIRSLFFRHLKPYIGAANNPFFKRELIDKVQFRQLDYRIWPSAKGRGADRDFNFNLAHTFNDSLFVDIPLYCWRTPVKFQDAYNLKEFLI